jgi:hypothetical protein
MVEEGSKEVGHVYLKKEEEEERETRERVRIRASEDLRLHLVMFKAPTPIINHPPSYYRLESEVNYRIQFQNLNRIKEYTILICIYLCLDLTFLDPKELCGN